MADLSQALEKVTELRGFLGACVANYHDDDVICVENGENEIDLQKASHRSGQVVRAKLKEMAQTEQDGLIDDILITLETQLYLIRLLPAKDGYFVFLALEKANSNLAMARFLLADVERALES